MDNVIYQKEGVELIKEFFKKIENFILRRNKIVFENYNRNNRLINKVEFLEFDNPVLNEFFEALEHFNQSGVMVRENEDGNIIINFTRNPFNIRVDGFWITKCVKIYFNRKEKVVLFNSSVTDFINNYDYSEIKEITIE
jgi:hypothetical protein